MGVKRWNIRICVLFVLVVGFVGCKTGGETVRSVEVTEQIAYESHVKKIVGKNCTGCHAY